MVGCVLRHCVRRKCVEELSLGLCVWEVHKVCGGLYDGVGLWWGLCATLWEGRW